MLSLVHCMPPHFHSLHSQQFTLHISTTSFLIGPSLYCVPRQAPMDPIEVLIADIGANANCVK